jgi:hypothetical protein
LFPATASGAFAEEQMLFPHAVAKWRSFRISTDGRDWPKEVELSFRGYSIGKWIDGDDSGYFRRLLSKYR